METFYPGSESFFQDIDDSIESSFNIILQAMRMNPLLFSSDHDVLFVLQQAKSLLRYNLACDIQEHVCVDPVVDELELNSSA